MHIMSSEMLFCIRRRLYQFSGVAISSKDLVVPFNVSILLDFFSSFVICSVTHQVVSCKGVRTKPDLFAFFLAFFLSLSFSFSVLFFFFFLKFISLVHNHPKQIHGQKIRYNKRNYCRHLTFKLQTIDGPCEVIVHTWETHLQPRSITPLGMGINCICLRHIHKIANMLHIGLEGLIMKALKYLNVLLCWRYKHFFFCTTWTLLSKKKVCVYIYICKWLKN